MTKTTTASIPTAHMQQVQYAFSRRRIPGGPWFQGTVALGAFRVLAPRFDWIPDCIPSELQPWIDPRIDDSSSDEDEDMDQDQALVNLIERPAQRTPIIEDSADDTASDKDSAEDTAPNEDADS